MSRKTIHDYFQQALADSHNTLTSPSRSLVSDKDGNCAAFEVKQDRGKVLDVRFKCTTCITLVALCEHIADLARGMNIGKAREIDSQMLLNLHPEVPAELSNRASLACRAFRAALRKVTANYDQGEQT